MTFILSFIYNFSMLISVSILSGFLYEKKLSPKMQIFIQGVIFGIATIITITHPVIFAKGIIFDGRSILVSLATYSFGPAAGLIVTVFSVVTRTLVGGIGAFAGNLISISAFLIACGFHYFAQKKNLVFSFRNIFIFQTLVHIGMLLSILTLPAYLRWNVFNRMWLIVLILYPIAGTFLSFILYEFYENRKLRNELEQTEERLRLLIKNLTDTVVVLNKNGEETFVSASVSVITGYKDYELIGKKIADVIHPDDLPEVYKAWDEVLHDPNLLRTVQYRHIHKEKGWVYLEAIAQNFIDEPLIEGVVCSVRDITDRIKTEQILKEKENKLKLLIELAPDAFFHGNKNGIFIDCNKKAVELTGYSKEELIGKNIEELFPTNILEKYPFDYQGLDSGKTIIRERELRKKNGVIIPVEMNSRKMPDGTYQSFFRDISFRKKAEEDLHLEKEKLMVTLNSIGDGVISTDLNGNILFINKTAERYLGYRLSELENKQFLQFIKFYSDENQQEIIDLVSEIIQTKSNILEFEGLYLKIDNDKIIQTSVTASTIRNYREEIEGIVISFRDITEKQKLLEIEQKSQKLESIGMLAGGIAHDFNNVLAGIFGYLNLAKIQSIDENVQTLLENAEKSIGRARKLTQKLLIFSKGGDPVKKTQDIISIIKDTVEKFKRESQLNISFNHSENSLFTKIDKNQILQVLDNVLLNAKESNVKNGKINVTVSKIAITKNQILQKGEYIKILVQDNGIGIPKELLSRIYDPFFTTKPFSHGLGLAICHSILKKHGGDIDIQSSEEGTTANIYLPLDSNSYQTKKNRKKIDKNSKTNKILIMDDEDVVRITLGMLLKTFDIEVIETKCGEEAIEKFKMLKSNGEVIDAVIFDLTVPGKMGGEQAIKQIKKIDEDVIAFVCSGYSSDPIMANPTDYGFTDRIPKPFTLNELKDTLSKYLKLQ